MRLVSRIVAIVIVAVLSIGAPGVCSGWAATHEARMACCADGGACAMHPADEGATQSASPVSQSDADACCASGEQGDSTPSAKTFVPVLALDPAVSPVLAVAPPIRTLFDVWLAPAPLDTGRVPRHVLLSVFLN